MCFSMNALLSPKKSLQAWELAAEIFTEASSIRVGPNAAKLQKSIKKTIQFCLASKKIILILAQPHVLFCHFYLNHETLHEAESKITISIVILRIKSYKHCLECNVLFR